MKSGANLIICAICWLISGFLFWEIFFKLTPKIVNLVPPGQWQPLLKIVIYALVGYLGGIGVPLVFFFLGIYILFQ